MTDMGHIPLSIEEGVVTMTLQPVYPVKMPTLFIGIVNATYTEEYWQDNLNRIQQLFGISSDVCTEIKLCPQADNPSRVDMQKFNEFKHAMDQVNKAQSQHLRIVHMGTGNSTVVNMAIESLVQGWRPPNSGEKYVQFVALGETNSNDMLQFARWLCLSRRCHGVQYYQTMDYNHFGFLDERHRFLHEFQEQKKEEQARGGLGRFLSNLFRRGEQSESSSSEDEAEKVSEGEKVASASAGAEDEPKAEAKESGASQNSKEGKQGRKRRRK